jgi:hypothetical protein
VHDDKEKTLSTFAGNTVVKIKFPGTTKQYGPSKDSIAFNLFPVISAFRRHHDTPRHLIIATSILNISRQQRWNINGLRHKTSTIPHNRQLYLKETDIGNKSLIHCFLNPSHAKFAKNK